MDGSVISPLVCWKMAGRHRNPSSCGSVGASCPDASGYKEYVTRCYTTTTKKQQQPRDIQFQIPGGVGRPSSYLFVGCQAGRVALGSSVHQEPSTRPEHKSQRCVKPDTSDIEDLGRGEVYLVARQELLVDNRMHCVVLGGDRLYAEVVRAEMNKMHIRNSLHETLFVFPPE